MRYYKGLGIGHIYSRLNPDDPLLASGAINGTQHVAIPADDDSNPAPSLLETDNWTIDDKSSEFSESDEKSLADSLDSNSDNLNDPNDDGEHDSIDDGSGDSLDLEYRDMYGDRGDSDYEE